MESRYAGNPCPWNKNNVSKMIFIPVLCGLPLLSLVAVLFAVDKIHKGRERNTVILFNVLFFAGAYGGLFVLFANVDILSGVDEEAEWFYSSILSAVLCVILTIMVNVFFPLFKPAHTEKHRGGG